MPELITWSYAKRLGIEHTDSALQFCEAILKSYGLASNAIMEREQWANLKKACR